MLNSSLASNRFLLNQCRRNVLTRRIDVLLENAFISGDLTAFETWESRIAAGTMAGLSLAFAIVGTKKAIRV